MKTPTLDEFKAWTKEHQSLALAVCKAQAFAECERERVDAYIRPIFDSYKFNDLPKVHDYQVSIDSPDKLYLCADEIQCAAFYADCDNAHRDHGFRGLEGTCPALMAEDMCRKAQSALLQAGSVLMGIEDIALYGDNRAKMLKLLLGACLIKEKKAA